MSKIHIRQAAPSDLPRLVEIATRAATAARWSRRQYEDMFSSGRLVLVVEDDGEVAGFVAGSEAAGEWEIENIAVIGNARRRGLGSRLLGEFLHHVRSKGGKAVFLEVRESNRAARALYEKWAFRETGRRKDYYLEPVEDALVLRFYFAQER